MSYKVEDAVDNNGVSNKALAQEEMKEKSDDAPQKQRDKYLDGKAKFRFGFRFAHVFLLQSDFEKQKRKVRDF